VEIVRNDPCEQASFLSSPQNSFIIAPTTINPIILIFIRRLIMKTLLWWQSLVSVVLRQMWILTKADRIFVSILVLFPLLVFVVGITQAQAPLPREEITLKEPDNPSELLSTEVPIQGRLTNGVGVPLDGKFDFTFRLYDSETDGYKWCESTAQDVDVVNGLFNITIDCSATDYTRGQLYLGVEVENDGEMSPRTPIYPVPYANTLRPGARIRSGNSFGLLVESNNGYTTGAAIRAVNSSDVAGTAIDAYSSSNGATIDVTNSGNGPLISGFYYPSNMKETAFQISNSGDFYQENSSNGLVKSGVVTECGTASNTIHRSFNPIYQSSITVSKTIYPGVCTIDFEFNLSGRYWTASSMDTSVIGPSTNDVSCVIDSSDNSILTCINHTVSGLGVDGPIMVLVY
jgi:hypothetical protein